MTLRENPPCFPHLGANRLEIGVIGAFVMIEHIEPVAGQMNEPLGIVRQSDDRGFLVFRSSDGNGTPGTTGTLAALMPRMAR